MARSFNGTSDAIDCGDAGGLDPQFPMTVVARLNAASITGTRGIIIRGRAGSNGWGFKTTGDELRFSKYGVADITSTTINLSASTDLLVAAVVAATNVRFAKVSIDGTLTAQDVANSSAFSGTPTIARLGCENNGANANFFSGVFGGVAKWNAALADDYLIALGEGMLPPFVQASSLAFYAPLIRDLVELRSGATLTATGTAVADHPRVIGWRKRSLIGRSAAGGGNSTLSGASQIASFTSNAALAVLAKIAGSPTIGAFTSDGALATLASLSGASAVGGFTSSGEMAALVELAGASEIGPFRSSGRLINPNAVARDFDTILRNRRRRWH